MLSDIDIKTILDFTSGEMDQMSGDSSGKIILFGHEGMSFELVTSSWGPFVALFVSPTGQGPILQYEFPVTTVSATPESFEHGGIHVIAGLHFYGGASGRRVLVIYKTNEKFRAEPIWDGEPPEVEIAEESKT